ncbi:MAG: ShlB/FhaC/HecB family hemolysin secretion/activation protein [Verrucomicrobiota bacterium]|nr:ShlB/FhaC/HecB family hemolysin secretion/activation protein [Verrucomicrobiota bacterium]
MLTVHHITNPHIIWERKIVSSLCTLLGLFILNLFVGSSFCFAQQSQPNRVLDNPGERFLERQQRERDQENRERPQDRLDVPREESLEVIESSEEPSFKVDSIELKGATLLSHDVVRSIVSRYEKSLLTRGLINKLMLDLTNAYIDAGYVTTRVYIPQQNLSSQKLKLQVVEGKIEKLSINKDGLRDRSKLWTAFPNSKGHYLNLRDLEQGLDQINRAPSGRAKLQMLPGEKPGESLVQIENKAINPYRFSTTFDNAGQKITGIERLRFALDLDNLLALNDMLSLNYIGSEDTNAFAGSASIPWGYWTFYGNASYSEYLTTLAPDAELLGDASSVGAGANLVVFRDKTQKTSFDLSLGRKSSGRILNDVQLASQTLTVMRFGATHLWRPANNVLQVDAFYHRGLPLFDAPSDPSSITRDVPHSEFNKFEANVYYFQPLLNWISFRSTLNGQYSVESLFGSEQTVMGDSATVRGYNGSGVAGDDGVFCRNELLFGVPFKIEQPFLQSVVAQLQPYAFFDAGYASTKASRVDSWLSGTGVGLRLTADRFNFDVTYATPVDHHNVTGVHSDELYFTVTLKAL